MKKLYSIGTVVILKEAEKRMMIMGYYPTIIRDDKEITCEYSGCLFPEGILDSSTTMMFNHEQIDKVFHYGLVDAEQDDFMNKLMAIVEEENNASSQSSNG